MITSSIIHLGLRARESMFLSISLSASFMHSFGGRSLQHRLKKLIDNCSTSIKVTEQEGP